MPDGEALPQALELAGLVAANGPLAVQAILRTMRETEGMAEDDAFAVEAGIGAEVFGSADAKEGPRAFAEKRPPALPGPVPRDQIAAIARPAQYGSRRRRL